jgi:hypothetical protein
MTSAFIPLLKGEEPGYDPVRRRFLQFAEELQQRAFPNATTEPPV